MTFKEFMTSKDAINPGAFSIVYNEYFDLMKKTFGIPEDIDLSVIPTFEPDQGKVEVMLAATTNSGRVTEEVVTRPSFRVYPPVVQRVSYADLASAEAAYDSAAKNDFLVVKADEPKRLNIGWLEVRGSGSIHHTIHIARTKVAK